MSPKHDEDYFSAPVTRLREDLSVALRAAYFYGFSEGICNHFSVELPDQSGRFLLNPRGILWSKLLSDDIVMVDREGAVLAGRHQVEPTAMYIHAAVHLHCRKAVVLHSHMPFATSLALTKQGRLDTTLSQTAMRFHGKITSDKNYNGLALSAQEGERIAKSINTANVGFLANHGVIVCADRIDYAFDDLYYLERACELEVRARSTGLELTSVSDELASHVALQATQERLQSELFFAELKNQFLR
jgi:ribulose-5-phosphate 4-epimerase/fuculose-1-phosphate aldolase